MTITKFRKCLDRCEANVPPFEEGRFKNRLERIKKVKRKLKQEADECKKKYKEGYKKEKSLLHNFFNKSKTKETVKFIAKKGQEGPTPSRRERRKEEGYIPLPKYPPNIKRGRNRWGRYKLSEKARERYGVKDEFEFSLNICKVNGNLRFENKKVIDCENGELFAHFHNHPFESPKPSYSGDLSGEGKSRYATCIASKEKNSTRVVCWEPIYDGDDYSKDYSETKIIDKKI